MKRSIVLASLLLTLVVGAIVMDHLLAQDTRDAFPKTGQPAADGNYLVTPGVQGLRSNGDPSQALPQKDYELGQQAAAILAKYQATEDSQQRDAMRVELQKVVADHFELRQQIREKELAQLEAQVRRLRNLHSRREQEKDKIIADRVQQLIRDAEGLGWGGDNAQSFIDMSWPVEVYRGQFPQPDTKKQ